MTEADERLAALFAADMPPARDPAFDACVMAALARRRFAREMLTLAGVSLVATAVLAMVWPAIGPALQAAAAPLGPAALAVVGALALAFFAAGLPAPAAGRQIMTKIS